MKGRQMSFTHKQNVIETGQEKTDFAASFKAAEPFDPAYGRILIKREYSALERRVKSSGLELPDNVKDNYKSAEGVLIKCGPNADDDAKKLIGKRILFSKYGGEDIIIPQPDGTKEEFVLAMDGDIFGELK